MVWGLYFHHVEASQRGYWSHFQPQLNVSCGILTSSPKSCHFHGASLYLSFWNSYCWACAYAILGFISPFHSFGAPLAQFYSFGCPRPIPILPSHWLLLSLLGFPGPNYHTLYFGVYKLFHHPHLLSSFLWAPLAHFYLPSISHGITISFIGLFWAHLLSLRAFYHSMGL